MYRAQRRRGEKQTRPVDGMALLGRLILSPASSLSSNKRLPNHPNFDQPMTTRSEYDFSLLYDLRDGLDFPGLPS